MAINDSVINSTLIGATQETEGTFVPDVIISGTVNSSSINFGLIGSNTVIAGSGEVTEPVAGTINSSVINFGLINSSIAGEEVVTPPVIRFKVSSQHESGFSDVPKVTANHQSEYFLGSFIKEQNDAGYVLGETGVRRQHEASAVLRTRVAEGVQHQASSALRVTNQQTGVYSTKIGAFHIAQVMYTVTASNSISYSINDKVSNQLDSDYAIKDTSTISNQHESSTLIKVQGQNSIDYSIRGLVVQQHESTFNLRIITVKQHESGWELKTRNFITNTHKDIWNIGQSTVINITDIPFIILRGEIIEIIDATVSQDEDGYAWLANVTLADIADYQKFNSNDVFTLNLLGELFELIVDTKGLNRTNPAAVRLSLSGLSPTALLSSPRGERFTKLWDAPVLAKDAAEEFLGGLTIDWQLINWTIPAFALGVTNVTAMEIVQLIATAAGGVVETNTDGSILVRQRHAVRVPDYDSSAVDQIYTDAEDNISVLEGQLFSKSINKVAIHNQSSSAVNSDTIQFESDEADTTKGVLMAYPSPFRDITITHTGPSSVVLSKIGEVLRTETEIIEIFDGSGGVTFPILSIDSIDWLEDDLGGLTFDGKKVNSTDLINKFSLVQITYTTKSINYDAQYVADTRKIQFLMETA